MENDDAETRLKVPFPDVVDSKINTKQFLRAATGILDLLENCGKVFGPARYDISGNIEKTTKKYNENPEKYEHLEDILFSEIEEKKGFATEALLWLRRGLYFFLVFFEEIVKDESHQEDLSDIGKIAYSTALKSCHGWLGSKLFHMLFPFMPRRTVVLRIIALDKEDVEDYVIKQLKDYNIKFRICIEHLTEFYKSYKLEPEVKT